MKRYSKIRVVEIHSSLFRIVGSTTGNRWVELDSANTEAEAIKKAEELYNHYKRLLSGPRIIKEWPEAKEENS